MDAIDIFSGAGGFTLGLKEVGVNTVTFVEAVQDRIDTFLGHTPGASLLSTDARQADFSSCRDRVVLVYGGPPCQPFSMAGKRLCGHDRRDMVPEFVRCVREIKPKAFLMENVEGLTKAGGYFDKVLADLAALGYGLSWRILDAADFGVPQHRRRLFVAGIANGMLRFPEPTHGPGRPHPHLTVNSVLPVNVPVGNPCRAKVTYSKTPVLRPSPYDGFLVNGQGRPIDPSRPARTIVATAGGNKTPFFDIDGVLLDYHAALKAGGPVRQGAVPGCRRLSVEESAALQGFDASVVFHGSMCSRYAQVGDAVPPPLARALGSAILEAMMG